MQLIPVNREMNQTYLLFCRDFKRHYTKEETNYKATLNCEVRVHITIFVLNDMVIEYL